MELQTNLAKTALIVHFTLVAAMFGLGVGLNDK
jgi:hypothetical protein